MLTVTVKGNHNVRAASQRVIDPRLQRRTLATVDQVGQNNCAGLFRLRSRLVTRSVVHHDHIGNLALHRARYRADTAGFVIGGNHHKD